MEKKSVETLRRSIVGELLPIFAQYPVVTASTLTDIYAQVSRRPLSMKAYGYKNLADFYKQLNIFDHLPPDKVTISRGKLVEFLFKPLNLDPSTLEMDFENVNGFPPKILCDFCGVRFLKDLKTIKKAKKKVATHCAQSFAAGGSLPNAPASQDGLLPDYLPLVQSRPTPPLLMPDYLPLVSRPTPPLLVPDSQRKLKTSEPSFPNAGIHPKDESFLPALPGHPGIDWPSPTATLPPPPRPVMRQGEKQSVMLEKVDAYIKQFISYFSSQGKHLPVCIVTEEVNAVAKNRIHRSDFKKIKSWDDFDKLYKRLDVFIRAFCWNCPFTSLYELQRTILEFEKVSSFEELHMGPILKHPLLQDLFKIPDNLINVPEITTYDILNVLNEFVNKYKKGDNVWDKLEEFMQFFAKKFSVSSPQYLCVRVSSYRLALSANFKFRTSQRQIRERREKEAAIKVDEIIDFEIESLKKSLKRMSQNERELINKSPVKIIEDVFTISKDVLPPHVQSRLFTFFSIVMKEAIVRKLFTVALYQGAYGVKQHVLEQEQHLSLTSSATVQHQEVFCHKPQGELTRAIENILKHEVFPISLEALARAEQLLVTNMNVDYFGSFHHGSFLEFIAKSDQLLKCVGGKHIGGTAGGHSRRNQVLAFIQQIKGISNDPNALVTILQQQFSAIEELLCTFGGVEKMISDAECSPALAHPHPIISYTTPLIVNDCPDKDKGLLLEQRCFLGPQSSKEAYLCLQKAPLLADLSEWTQWDLIFASSLGPLCDFLTKQDDSKFELIYALHDSSGRLLKINPKSTKQDFVAAIEALNPVDAAGHLVSMAVSLTSIHLMSTQLLAKCVATRLEQVERDGGGELLSEYFVFHCLQRIPLELCVILGRQVFIDPLRKVKSAATVNKLIQFCETPSQRWLLQALGIKLGINEWINDFKEMKTNHGRLTGLKLPKKFFGQPKDHAPMTAEVVKLSTKVEAVDDGLDANGLLKPNLTHDHEAVSSMNKYMGAEEARKVVNTIREEEFGIGLELNQQQAKIADKQKEREGRGLQRLSQELYSKDTHFVLELIQNADDNTYSLTEVSVPTVKFILHSDCISVLNNEVGFSEGNIRAICDVGKSTKDPLRSGYIGQKGIGFKSVFRVTNKPEIHSRGFHIQFDTTSGPIGYILPEWIQRSYIDGKIPPSELSKWTTQIVLPLKTESRISQNMAKKFQDIQPSLLLFLNRLRSIIIYDAETGEERKMVRIDEDDGVTVIRHNEGTNHWLVARKELSDANHYKAGVQTTDLAIAFPLPEDLLSLPSARDLLSQQVFAFLPLRSYGFRFVVQGDFDLPSSREDVNEDSAWNQWLRENIPPLFLEALENMKVLPRLDVIQAISLFVQFIPLDGEVHDFFKPVTSQILQLLKGSRCLPTDPLETCSNVFCKIVSLVEDTSLDFEEEPQLMWKQPSQLITVAHDFIRDYIPQSILADCLNIYYLHASLVPRMGPDLCTHLGIGEMTIDHLIAVASSVLDSYHSNMEIESDSGSTSTSDDESSVTSYDCLVSWIAHWLGCVYTTLEEMNSVNPHMLLNLKKLKIIPLMNQTLVSLDDGTVFFPPTTDTDKKYKDIYRELKTVDGLLLETGDQITRGKVYQMLSINLGVKELNTLDIINHHIIPQFKLSAQNKEGILILYLQFIKNALNEVKSSQLMAQLKACVQLVTNKGIKSPSLNVIHFSPQYEDQWNLSKLFPEVKWTMLSSKYLEKNADISSWRKFFLGLGVTSGLAVQRINQSVDPAHHNDLVSIWNTSAWSRSPDGKYTVRDYYCKEFDEILDSVMSKSTEIKFQRVVSLAKMLDSCWNTLYKTYITTEYYDGENINHLGKVISSFGACIRDKPWLPAVDVKGQPYSSGVVMKGDELYIDTDENVHLFHTHVPYLGVTFQNHELLQAVKVKSSVTPEVVLNYLKKWSQSSRDNPFVTSVDHMMQVYIFLYKHKAKFEDIEKAFGELNLIFIPMISDWEHTQIDVKGEFFSVHDTCWNDKTTIVYNMLYKKETPPSYLPHVLSYFYISKDEELVRSIKSAFLGLGVNKHMKFKFLINLLEYNSSLAPRPDRKHLDNFTSIANVVVDSIVEQSTSLQNQEYSVNEVNRSWFTSNTKDNEVFPTTGKKWSTLSNLFIDDAPDVSKYFIKSHKICFLDWSESSSLARNKRKMFIDIFKIPLLSKRVQKTLTPESIRPFSELQKLFHHLVPLIQSYIVSHINDKGETYHQHIQKLLIKLKFFSTIKLNCTYEIGNELHVVQIRQCQLAIDSEQAVVYAVVDQEGKYLEKTSLVNVLAAVLDIDVQMNFEFRMFLQSLITDEPTSEEDKKVVMEKYNLDGMDEFPEWSVELPQKFFQDEERLSDDTENTSDHEELRETEDGSDTGLRVWPPRAAVDSSFSKKPVRIPTKELGNIPSTKDMITSDYVAEIRKKVQIEDQTNSKHDQPTSRHQEVSSQPNTSKHQKTLPQGTQQEENPDEGKSSSLPVTKQPKSKPGKNQVVAHDEESNASKRVNLAEDKNASVTQVSKVSSSHVHKKKIPDFQNLEALEISHLMQNIPLEGFQHSMPDIQGEKEPMMASGEWGEMFVCSLFKQKRVLPNGLKISTIKWENEVIESGLPYDIKISTDDGTDYFVEVKSTSSSDKELLPFSWKEIKFAKEQAETYALIRVYNAFSIAKVQVKWLLNIYHVIESNQSVRLFLKL